MAATDTELSEGSILALNMPNIDEELAKMDGLDYDNEWQNNNMNDQYDTADPQVLDVWLSPCCSKGRLMPVFRIIWERPHL